jgi:hypothetical protein
VVFVCTRQLLPEQFEQPPELAAADFDLPAVRHPQQVVPARERSNFLDLVQTDDVLAMGADEERRIDGVLNFCQRVIGPVFACLGYDERQVVVDLEV